METKQSSFKKLNHGISYNGIKIRYFFTLPRFAKRHLEDLSDKYKLTQSEILMGVFSDYNLKVISDLLEEYLKIKRIVNKNGN